MSPKHPFALALLVGLSLAGPARAFDVDAFIARADASFSAIDYAVTFGSPVVSGDDVIFSEVEVVQYPDNEPVKIVAGPVVVEGVTERPDGSFTVDRVKVGPVDYTYQHHFAATDQTFPLRVVSGGLTLTDLYFPAGPMDAMAVEALYGGADLQGWQMYVSDNLQFSLGRWTHAASFEPAQTAETITAMRVAMTVERFDSMLVPGQFFDDILAAQGRDRLVYDMNARYDWDIAKGLIDFSTLDISADGLGTLELTGRAQGYDADLFALVTDLYTRMDDKLLAGDAEAARGLEQQVLLTAGPRVTLSDLEIVYEDQGLVRQFAAEQGLLPLYEIAENFSHPDERALAATLHAFLTNPTRVEIRQTRPETLFNIWRKFPDPFEMILALDGEMTLDAQ